MKPLKAWAIVSVSPKYRIPIVKLNVHPFEQCKNEIECWGVFGTKKQANHARSFSINAAKDAKTKVIKVLITEVKKK